MNAYKSGTNSVKIYLSKIFLKSSGENNMVLHIQSRIKNSHQDFWFWQCSPRTFLFWKETVISAHLSGCFYKLVHIMFFLLLWLVIASNLYWYFFFRNFTFMKQCNTCSHWFFCFTHKTVLIIWAFPCASMYCFHRQSPPPFDKISYIFIIFIFYELYAVFDKFFMLYYTLFCCSLTC